MQSDLLIAKLFHDQILKSMGQGQEQTHNPDSTD